MVRYFLLCALAASAGCSFGDDRHTGNGDAGPQPDGMMKEKDHLLISEVFTEGSETAEFVEIWNPTSRDISLDGYFLSDYANYWKLPIPTGTSGALSAVQSDFLVGFPAGAVIKSKQVITVAMKPSVFQTTFSVPATYGVDITADANGTKAFSFRIVGAIPGITDTGELISLFYWDRQNDLVKDVDLVLTGTSGSVTAGNKPIPKGPVDGPDPNNAESSYELEDGSFGGGMVALTGSFQSYKRRKLETGAEKQDIGGNGITGDDETSEPQTMTWDGDAGFTAPTPGTIPAI